MPSTMLSNEVIKMNLGTVLVLTLLTWDLGPKRLLRKDLLNQTDCSLEELDKNSRKKQSLRGMLR